MGPLRSRRSCCGALFLIVTSDAINVAAEWTRGLPLEDQSCARNYILRRTRTKKKKMNKVKLKVSKMLSAGRSKSISSRGRGGKSPSRTRLSPAERLKVAQLLRDNKITIADACQQYDIDNCPAHIDVPLHQNVDVIFLPPNVTSVVQPMDAGITRTVKVRIWK